MKFIDSVIIVMLVMSEPDKSLRRFGYKNQRSITLSITIPKKVILPSLGPRNFSPEVRGM